MTRKKLIISAILCVLSTWAFLQWSPWFKEKPPACLRILTYSTMASTFGAGPVLIDEFAKVSGCRAELIKTDSSLTMLRFYELFATRDPIDVVLGLDQFELIKGQQLEYWRPLSESVLNLIPTQLPWPKESYAAPFDWSPLTFIYRKDEMTPPSSWSDLEQKEYMGTLSLTNPELSPAGMMFLWGLAEGGYMNEEQILKIAPSIHSVFSSWSTAYGFFQKGLAKLSFSYATSAVYHWIEDKNENYQPAVLKEGHPYQIEFATIAINAKQITRAEEFLRFLLSPEAQKLLMQKNYMLPVLSQITDGTPFAKLPRFPLFDQKSFDRVLQQEKELVLLFKEKVEF